MSNPDRQDTAREKARKRERLALRIGAMVSLALEDDKVDPRDVYAILSGEAERVKKTLPS